MSFEIRKVGVIGAGQMGKGIAHVCALSGFDVALNDVNADRIAAGIADIGTHMRKSVERGFLAGDAVEGALPRLAAAPALQDFSDCDIVIEAATEMRRSSGRSCSMSRRS